jgi:hypothetical protein
MSKEVQMSIKMERDLRDEFIAAAASTHRPAAQIVREFMRAFISKSGEVSHEPNAQTLRAMEEVERGEVYRTKDVDDFCRQLGIPCEK